MDDSESNLEEVPEMMANLSAVAVDGVDPDNSKELEKDKRHSGRAWPPGPGPRSLGARAT
eukprot:11166381-Lingulodinium_polyedra.AAC.1